MTTDAAVPAVRHDVANNDTTTSGVQNDAVNTPAIVSDSHRNALKRREDVGGKNRAVCITHTLTVAELPLTTA